MTNAEEAARVVREALARWSCGPHGDLLLGADRAAGIAVAALRDAGLLRPDPPPDGTEKWELELGSHL